MLPQNVAWLAAFRYAKKDIYVQSPDLNAAPVVQAVIDTVNRGVLVTLCLCWGYNDFVSIP